jgi:hypothetical protein
MPTKRPIDCCEDVQRFIKDEFITACSAECSEDQCCQGNCLANYLKLLKDGEFNKESALDAVKSSFEGDENWLKVRVL